MGKTLEERWTKKEEDRLRQWWGRAPVGEIARRFGRTETAVTVRAKRIGLRSLVNHPDALAEWQLARMLGLDRKTVWAWMNRGVLPVDTIYKRSLPCRVTWRADLVRWLRDYRNWVYMHPARIADPELRRIATGAMRAWGDEWLPAGQAAAVLGLDRQMLNKLNHRGVFRETRKNGRWFYRRSEIETLRGLVGKSWEGR